MTLSQKPKPGRDDTALPSRTSDSDASAMGPTRSIANSVPQQTLAAVLDQSVDCVKLIGLDGRIEYMNFNGQCAMEIADVCAVLGQPWCDLWPEEARVAITNAQASAGAGGITRFDAYCPTALGSPRWWNVSVSPIRSEDGIVTGVLSISRDITEAELGRQALVTATAEMRHRLKNTYAMTGSLLSGFARGNPVREEFAQEMIERLSALGVAQTLFAARENAPCRISDLIPALVRAFDRPDCPVTIDGLADADVDQGQADAIALVLGELAVNSAKHGALSSKGDVVIRVTRPGDEIVILWCERSDRIVEAKAREGGQGLRLMQRIVRARKGAFTIEWADNGLDARMSFILT